MDDKLALYLKYFKKLNRSRVNGGAPHKPILLLSLINLFEQKLLSTKFIEVTPELVAAFRGNWNKLVETQHQSNFALPFYHMKSEPFWKLIPNMGYEKVLKARGSIKSLSGLKSSIHSAVIDNDLVFLFVQKETRELLKTFILENYFSNSAKQYKNSNDLFSGIDLKEDAATYREKLIKLSNILDSSEFEEEVFIRSGVFKREIPKIYNNTCAISGLQINATANISMVDACHIVPFAESYNDTITNGIALCPNLHRAFDRGLVSISDNYRVILADNFIEESNSTYNLRQFEGVEINLPAVKDYYPDVENLRLQRERFTD